jgi:hypothetical protein
MTSACMKQFLFRNDFSLTVHLRTESTAAMFGWVKRVTSGG